MILRALPAREKFAFQVENNVNYPGVTQEQYP
jgi:hypothetical protein